ncbi:STAS domain-containing protein [Thorsellia anophelis]|uniref:STAS domain-containing protein n=1 Tax=Thorsellia anophelis DSM 18579 TaxID=1123402 RepID=A0A1H9ZZK3_9GAMM|nr:STAS domain-containing protein [Thorsellia anophelis]SES86848.1 STAS domain-containing protein [Thorsellia anophelis DSM 18579]
MSEVKVIFKLFKQAPIADSVILCITFFLTVFTDLIIAVNLGVLIAILYFLKQASNHVTIKLEPLPAEYPSTRGCKILIRGPLFFASLSKLDNIISQTDSNSELIVFDFEQVPFTDATGLEKLKIAIDELNSANIRVECIGMSPLVLKQLKQANIH